MNISPSFSPSIRVMKPYFILSAFFYLLSILGLFFINPHAKLTDFEIVGWVHLYMLGFVMLAIFAAMAQLGPIVVETKHYNVNVFKYVWKFLTLGLIVMLLGFYIDVEFLIYGGVIVLVAMGTYAIEFLLTLKSAKRKTAITKAMKMSNLFLLIGIISGLLMALGFSGYINLNPHAILKAHTFGLIAGFVILLIMGISIILIPMFGLAKRISDNEFSKSFFTLSLGVTLMILSPLFLTPYLEFAAYAITTIAILLYLYQLVSMTKSRAKVIHDIWARSMYVGFASFILSFILLLLYLFTNDAVLLKLGMWIMLVGFFGFLIMGNFYKIVPFLIWFQIYSPLIEERDVPMLHDLLPKKLTDLQWIYSSLGLVTSSLGVFTQNEIIFHGGVTFLLSGGLLFMVSINKMFKTNL